MEEKMVDELWEERGKLEEELERVVMGLNELGGRSDWEKIEEKVKEEEEKDKGLLYNVEGEYWVKKLEELEKEELVKMVKRLRSEVDVLWDLREGNLRVGKEKVE
jgi:hypothetical protein